MGRPAISQKAAKAQGGGAAVPDEVSPSPVLAQASCGDLNGSVHERLRN